MLKVQQFQELTGKQYVQAEIACMQDKTYEKKKWDERIAYAESLDFNNQKIFRNASNPIGLRAAYLALIKAQNGEPSGHMISLDAASSGMQLLSLLVSCPVSWKLCGGDEDILDSYTHIYQSMKIDNTLKREQVKKAIMTAMYGSVEIPETVFGEHIDLFHETMEKMAPGAWDLNLGLQDLWGEVKGSTYDWVMPDNFYACIETEDKEVISFHFLDTKYQVIKKVNKRPKFHKGLGPNLIHSIDGMIVREMYRRCQFKPKVVTRVINLILNSGKKNRTFGVNGRSAEMVKTLWSLYKESGFLSVRILDYLYEDTMGLVDPVIIAELIQSMPSQSFQLVTVHDCFRCHPNYGNEVRHQYNTILADINDSKLLQYMVSQVANKKIKIRKMGKIPREVILNANYLLS